MKSQYIVLKKYSINKIKPMAIKLDKINKKSSHSLIVSLYASAEGLARGMDNQKHVGLKGGSLCAKISSSLYQIVFVQQGKKKCLFFCTFLKWNVSAQSNKRG